jgi:hypothetical protein
MINPQDYTGENPLWQSSEPYFDSFYWYDTDDIRPLFLGGLFHLVYGICFALSFPSSPLWTLLQSLESFARSLIRSNIWVGYRIAECHYVKVCPISLP